MEHTSDQLASQFVQVRPLYEAFASRLEMLIGDLLRDMGLSVIQTESRAKTQESFLEKAQRKSDKYADPLADITDLAGLRIVTYYLADVDQVEKLIDSEFTIDKDKSVDKSKQEDPDRFGYQSRHYVVTLDPSRARLAEWRKYKDLRAEIQVRTALQHAWAAVSHKLDYKNAQEVPWQLRRGLYRLSALFELADDQFTQFSADARKVDAYYREKVFTGDTEIPLDLQSVRAYFESPDTESKNTERVRSIASSVGWKFHVEGDEEVHRDQRDLLTVAAGAGFRTVADLETVLSVEDKRLQAAVEALLANLRPSGADPETSIENLLTCVIAVLHPSADEVVASIYGSAWLDAFKVARESLA